MANEFQTLTFSDTTAIGGTWTITFDGQTTGGLAHNADAAAVQTAMALLSNVGSGNIGVAGTVASGFTLQFQGALANTDVPEVTVDSSGLLMSAAGVSHFADTEGVDYVDAVTEAFSVNGGFDETVTFSDGNESGWVQFDSDGNVQSYSGPGSYSVSSGGSGTPSIGFTCLYAQAMPDHSKTSGGGGSVTVDTQGADAVAGEVEIQILQLIGSPTSGTWAPAGGENTVSFDASSGDVEAAIETVSGLGVSVTDNAAYPNVGFTITYDDTGNRSLLSPDTSNLRKAWDGTISVDTQTEGDGGGGIVPRINGSPFIHAA